MWSAADLDAAYELAKQHRADQSLLRFWDTLAQYIQDPLTGQDNLSVMECRSDGFPTDLMTNGYLLNGADIVMLSKYPLQVELMVNLFRSRATSLREDSLCDETRPERLLRWAESEWLDRRAEALSLAARLKAPVSDREVGIWRELYTNMPIRAGAEAVAAYLANYPDAASISQWHGRVREHVRTTRAACGDEAACHSAGEDGQDPLVEGAGGRAAASPPVGLNIPMYTPAPPPYAPASPVYTPSVAEQSRLTSLRPQKRVHPGTAVSPTGSASAPGWAEANPSTPPGEGRPPQSRAAPIRTSARPPTSAGERPCTSGASAGGAQVQPPLEANKRESAADSLKVSQTTGTQAKGGEAGEGAAAASKKRGKAKRPRGKKGKSHRIEADDHCTSTGAYDIERVPGLRDDDTGLGEADADICVCDWGGWVKTVTFGLEGLSSLGAGQWGCECMTDLVIHKMLHTARSVPERPTTDGAVKLPQITFLPVEVWSKVMCLESRPDYSEAFDMRRLAEWKSKMTPHQSDVIIAPVNIGSHYLLACLFNPGKILASKETCHPAHPAPI